MPLSTTTLAAAIAQLAQKLEELVPAYVRDKVFNRSPTNQRIRTWARGGSDCFRAFEIFDDSPETVPGMWDPGAAYVTREILVTVAYSPALLTLAGTGELDSLRTLIESDAHQIWKCAQSAANYVDGVQNMEPHIDPTDTNDPSVWFLEVRINVHWFRSLA